MFSIEDRQIARYLEALRGFEGIELLRLGVKSELLTLGTALSGEHLLRLAIDRVLLDRLQCEVCDNIGGLLTDGMRQIANLERERRNIQQRSDADLTRRNNLCDAVQSADISTGTSTAETLLQLVLQKFNEQPGFLADLSRFRGSDGAVLERITRYRFDSSFDDVCEAVMYWLVFDESAPWSRLNLGSDFASNRLLLIADYLTRRIDTVSYTPDMKDTRLRLSRASWILVSHRTAGLVNKSVFETLRAYSSVRQKRNGAIARVQRLTPDLPPINADVPQRAVTPSNDDQSRAKPTPEQRYWADIGAKVDMHLQQLLDDGAIDSEGNPIR